MIELDKDTFDPHVIESNELVLVDFFSDGCEPCKALLPHIEEMASEFEGKIKFCKFNTTKARRLAIREKVLGLPTIIIYKDGTKISEVTKDDATKENVRKMIEAALA